MQNTLKTPQDGIRGFLARRKPNPVALVPVGRRSERRAAEEQHGWLDAHRFGLLTQPAPAAPEADPVVAAFQADKTPDGCSGALCSVLCARNRWIGHIDALQRPDLYGCFVHGHAHECCGQACRVTFTHADGHVTCVFSGRTLNFYTVYMGRFGEVDAETTHQDDDDDYNWDIHEASYAQKDARASPPPDDEPEAAAVLPRRPSMRRITNIETIARDVLHAVFANQDGRNRLLAVLLARARVKADRAVAAIQKRAPIRVRGMLVADARRVPHDPEMHEALAGPFRGLACVGAVYPWPDPPVALRPPTCCAEDYVAISEWLRRTIVRLWGILERCGCCKNAVAAFHALCVYVALTAAEGKPLRVHIYGAEDVLIPASEVAGRAGVPADWIKLIEHLSTPNCCIRTSHFNDGRTALTEMLGRLTSNFDRAVYIDARRQIHELHAIHVRGGNFSKLRPAPAAGPGDALPDR